VLTAAAAAPPPALHAGAILNAASPRLAGFAGNFTSDQAARLSECLPGAVHYKEPDRQVFKAEHSEYWKAQHLAGDGPSGGGRRLQGDNGADFKIQASAVDGEDTAAAAQAASAHCPPAALLTLRAAAVAGRQPR
jgi:hypothetical protein